MSHSYLKQESEAKRLQEMRHYLCFTIEALEDKLANHTFTVDSAVKVKLEIESLNKRLKELR